MRQQRITMSFLILGLAACGNPGLPDSGAKWDAFTDRTLEEYFEANPPFAVQAGRHDFDGRLPDWSEAGLRSEIERLHAARDECERFDMKSLNEEQRFERENLLAAIDLSLFWIERAESPWKNPDFYIGFGLLGPGLSPDVYLTRPYASLTDRMRAYVKWARAVPQAVEQAHGASAMKCWWLPRNPFAC